MPGPSLRVLSLRNTRVRGRLCLHSPTGVHNSIRSILSVPCPHSVLPHPDPPAPLRVDTPRLPPTGTGPSAKRMRNDSALLDSKSSRIYENDPEPSQIRSNRFTLITSPRFESSDHLSNTSVFRSSVYTMKAHSPAPIPTAAENCC